LFAESNPQDAPFPVTHYPSSGLSLFGDYSAIEPGQIVRGMYWATSYDKAYVVIGQHLYQINGPGSGGLSLVGDLGSNSGNPVRMQGNGTTMVIVDGSHVPPQASGTIGHGWTVQLETNAFAPINDPNFYGSNNVDFIDTYLVFNWPGTPTFYTTVSNSTDFVDPQQVPYFAEKIGYVDDLVVAVCLHDNIWLLGAVTSEVWFNAGAAAFPFARMPNSIIQQGCVAPYSAVVADNAVFWLSQDRFGRAMLMRGEGYQARRVSNFAVEHEWAKYGPLVNTMAMVYNQAGHEIVLLQFPEANATWAYDAVTRQFHRRTYGPNQDAWLPYCTSFVGSIWGQDFRDPLWLAGSRAGPQIYEISRNVYTDAGMPIKRVRAWPHLLNDGKKLSHTEFVAAMQAGTLTPDLITLRWSDDGGNTWGNPVDQANIGWNTLGQYSWNRLGMCRDRVYELSWTSPGETALNGAWVQAIPSET